MEKSKSNSLMAFKLNCRFWKRLKANYNIKESREMFHTVERHVFWFLWGVLTYRSSAVYELQLLSLYVFFYHFEYIKNSSFKGNEKCTFFYLKVSLSCYMHMRLTWHYIERSLVQCVQHNLRINQCWWKSADMFSIESVTFQEFLRMCFLLFFSDIYRFDSSHIKENVKKYVYFKPPDLTDIHIGI